MAEVARETMCASCIHRSVCAHKENYLEVIKTLEDTFDEFREDVKAHINIIDPVCKHHMEVKNSKIDGLSLSEVAKHTPKPRDVASLNHN